MVIKYKEFPIYTFFNKSLNILEDFNTTFMATGILSVLMLYLLFATMAGNFSVGIRIPFLMTFHPMMYNYYII